MDSLYKECNIVSVGQQKPMSIHSVALQSLTLADSSQYIIIAAQLKRTAKKDGNRRLVPKKCQAGHCKLRHAVADEAHGHRQHPPAVVRDVFHVHLACAAVRPRVWLRMVGTVSA